MLCTLKLDMSNTSSHPDHGHARAVEHHDIGIYHAITSLTAMPATWWPSWKKHHDKLGAKLSKDDLGEEAWVDLRGGAVVLSSRGDTTKSECGEVGLGGTWRRLRDCGQYGSHRR